MAQDKPNGAFILSAGDIDSVRTGQQAAAAAAAAPTTMVLSHATGISQIRTIPTGAATLSVLPLNVGPMSSAAASARLPKDTSSDQPAPLHAQTGLVDNPLQLLVDNPETTKNTDEQQKQQAERGVQVMCWRRLASSHEC